MMKRLFYVCTLFLLITGMVSCSIDDDDVIVQEAAATEEVKAFFNEDFTYNYENEFASESIKDPASYNLYASPITGFFTFGEYEQNPIVVRSINSHEEFECAYHGKFQLPDIDFSKYTLIVGITKSINSLWTLGPVRLVQTKGLYELQVILNKNINPHALGLSMVTPLLFWKIYPKFPTNKMIVVRRTENI